MRKIIDATETDGWLVWHKGEIVIEEYPGTWPYPREYPGKMPPKTKHLLMSVTKPLTATIAGILQHGSGDGKIPAGMLDPTENVSHYVQALKGYDYGDNTVEDVLDMRSDIKFSEEYLDSDSDVAKMEAASGWGPLVRGNPHHVKEFLKQLPKDPNRPDGRPFTYRSSETAVLGWVCEEAYAAATGTYKPFWKLVSELLWSKLGVDKKAYITVDSHNTAAFDGGICATLRDLARFGVMICNGGTSLTGVQVVDPKWVNDIFTAGSATAFRRDPCYPELGMRDGKFRKMFWSRVSDPDVVLCIGVYGQLVYINRKTQTVGVKLSSWPKPKETDWNDIWKGSSAVSMFGTISANLP